MSNYNNVRNNETYNKLINKIAQATRPNNNTNLHEFQNRRTINNNDNYYNINNQNTNKITYNLRNNQAREIPQNNMHIYDKMNQKLLEMKNNPENNKNYNMNNNINNNGKNKISENSIFYHVNENNREPPLGGGKDAPIVKILNQYNNQNEIETQRQQNINAPYQSNNNMNVNNMNNHLFLRISNGNNTIEYSNTNNNYNPNVLENSNSNHPRTHANHMNNSNLGQNQNQNSNKVIINPLIADDQSQQSSDDKNGNCKLVKSLLYGLIFGSLGTLLLWCKNPRVREYLRTGYQNINSESILNFFKSLLHPIDLIKSLGINLASFKEVLKESLKYLYNFIDDYSDLWRLLGIVVMVYLFWIIVKLIIRKISGNKNKNKKRNEKRNEKNDGHYQVIY